MGSLDVDLLFTNTLKLPICFIIMRMFIDSINKVEFKNLLSLSPQESYFTFNDVLYKENDVMAMGLPLTPTMANVFWSFYGVIWLEQCPKKLKPLF